MGKFLETINNRRGLLIIIFAALLLELISAFQYYYVRDLLEDELEHRAEGELIRKGAFIKNTLNTAELVLKDHIWDVRQNLNHPDSVLSALYRLGATNGRIRGAALAFVPGYYPKRDSLYEVYARKDDDHVRVSRIPGERHDYTKMEFYQKTMETGKAVWVDPYIDNEGAGELATTFAMPIYDSDGRRAGVLGVDISLDWLGDTLDRRHAYPSSFNILLTEDGRLFLGPKEERATWSTAEEVAQLINDSTVRREESVSKRSKVIDIQDKGEEGTVFYANLKGYPHWQLAVVCYDNEVYGKLRQMRMHVFLFMLAGFLLLGYLVWRNIRSLSRLKKADMERERISTELHVAQSIQMEMLPKKFPAFPDRDDIDIYGTLVPAKEVGGDLFDFYLRDEKLFFCIGDVSGKGVPAALVMAVVHAQFRMATAHESNPVRIMQTINAASCEGNESNIFVTFFVGVLDLPSGKFRYCNAGHDFPLIQRGDGPWQPLDTKANLPLGLFNDFKYVAQETDLSEGDSLFLYTDGLTEAMNPQLQQMRIQRVRKVLDECQTKKPEQLVHTMVDRVKAFVDGAEQSDDLTMLVIGYTPHTYELILHDQLVLTNKVSEVKRLNAFIKSVTDRLGLPPSAASKIKLAVEEAVANVINYAYPKGVEGEVMVEADSNGKCLKIAISDSGMPFDPTEAARADTTLSVEERPVGGLGILLVRELMDSINYERQDGRNILTLRKDYV